ncbi:hypothetical protein [Azonexus sp.]|uniref:hypothetical protein n=1 Tax=Azonexus sp. TaxID=1872668 RepID=UPI0027BAF725|nr:hypothetical protein [Azonexus sp.]
MKIKVKRLLQSLLLILTTSQIHAGEIVLTGENKGRVKTADTQDINLQEDEGVLSPRGGAPADERQYDAKVRERSKPVVPEDSRQEIGAAVVIMQTPNGPVTVRPGRKSGGNQEQSGALIEKARVYADRPAVNPDVVMPPRGPR